MRRLLLKHIVMPGLALFTPHKAWRYYKAYLKSEYDAPEVRQQRVWQKLQRLIHHAYENVPLYKEKWDAAGVKPDDIRSLGDFSRIPVTTKQDLREGFPDRVIARNYASGKLRYSNTSGTTGRALLMVQDLDDINYKYAAKLRSRKLEGIEVGDRMARTTPNECRPCLESGLVSEKGFWQYLKSVLAPDGESAAEYFVFLESKIIQPIFHGRMMLPPIGPQEGDVSDEAWEFYLREISRYKPAIWCTNPLYAYLMAKVVRRKGLTPPKVKAIDFSGGLVTPKVKRFVSETFGAPAYQSYGGCEFSRYGQECGQSGGMMHILEDHCHVEFLTPSGQPAKPGELANHIVTSLTNYAEPTIRFEHGDVGYYKNDLCACGRTTRLLDVEGRLQSTIITADGQTLTEQFFVEKFIDFPGVEWFQLTQRSPAEAEMLVIQDPSASSGVDVKRLAEELRACIGGSANVKVVRHIPQEASGKYMLVKSCSYEHFRCATAAASSRA